MQSFAYVSIVTLLAILTYVWMGGGVGAERRRSGIAAPAMTGDPQLERTIRAHVNTLEWMPIFLPSLWIFALYWNDRVAAGLGVIWIIGRVIYFVGYRADASRRALGFYIQALAAGVLLFGALGRAIYVLAIT